MLPHTLFNGIRLSRIEETPLIYNHHYRIDRSHIRIRVIEESNDNPLATEEVVNLRLARIDPRFVGSAIMHKINTTQISTIQSLRTRLVLLQIEGILLAFHRNNAISNKRCLIILIVIIISSRNSNVMSAHLRKIHALLEGVFNRVESRDHLFTFLNNRQGVIYSKN